MELNKLNISQIHNGLVKKEFSAVEATEACLNAIGNKDKKIHAFLALTPELAISQAREVDKKIKANEKISILEGVPVAVKDNILVDGIKCTAGSKILENYIAPYDATVIKKIKKHGAVILGKTNLDEFAMGSSTEKSAYGPTRNPHDLNRVPGGSSGGSAAAVAADECIYAFGSDTGGSIREPASFCGVVGLKPTYGAVSRYGLMAMASSLDQIGPLAKTVEDAQIVFEAIKGKDEMDSTSVNPKFEIQNPKQILTSNFKLQNLKIGVPKEYFIKGIDAGVAETIRKAIKKYEEMGAKIEEISLPNTEYALSCYYIIMVAEVSANLARYDGIKYGISKRGKDLLDVYLKSREEGFGDEARRRIILGAYVLSSGYYDAYYAKAQKIRTLIKQDFKRAFEKVDVIMTPVSPFTAFKVGEKIDNPLSMYLADIYTVSINLAGLPAMSLPCGKQNNLPVGLQIIGNQFEEDKIFETGKLFEKNF